MSDSSSISWTDATWNPILGCDRVSPGCDGCYAIGQAHMRAANPNPKVANAFAGLTRRTDTRLDWTGQVNVLADRLTQPLKWRKPRRIFVNSMSDLFHDDVPSDYIATVFAVMALTPRHTYQVLTKRHGRMRSLLSSGHFVAKVWGEVDKRAPGVGAQAVTMWPSMPLPNVWLGVSVEDQKRADLRIPALIDTPAAVRFVSAEPLLGPIDLFGPLDEHGGRSRLSYWLHGRPGVGPAETTSTGLDMRPLTVGPRLDWVIVGGESGPNARPMHPDWVRSLRDQCTEAHVPFHFKQWGEWIPESLGAHVITEHTAKNARYADVDGHHRPANIGARNGAATCHRVGKKAAGRELDGREWSEYPQPAEVSL